MNNGLDVLRDASDHKVHTTTARSTPPAGVTLTDLHVTVNGLASQGSRCPIFSLDMVMSSQIGCHLATSRWDSDRADVEGLYLSDGWHQKSAFWIPGKTVPEGRLKAGGRCDCVRLADSTTWYDKFIYVADREWTLRMQRRVETLQKSMRCRASIWTRAPRRNCCAGSCRERREHPRIGQDIDHDVSRAHGSDETAAQDVRGCFSEGI